MAEATEKLIIDGIEVEVPAGTSILEAARSIGIDIPHFCYHPHLSLAGNCRMCLVDIEKMPKLQISCGTPVKSGMVVHTNNERVRAARKAVLELQLVNHPIDCPICDQAGECKLQDYYMEYSLQASRMEVPKVVKPALVYLGGDVVHNGERCVTCLRCVRFLTDVTRTGELCAVNRGDHTEIDILEGRPISNLYSGNVVDVCPVGAMTSKDFRFKKRVWYLTTTESVCPGCERGCNTSVEFEQGRSYSYEPRPAKVFRVKPRRNDEVNKTWLCDPGRFLFHGYQAERYLGGPLLSSGGTAQPSPWNEALDAAADLLRKAGRDLRVIASPDLSCEELYLLRLLTERLGTTVFGWHPAPAGEWGVLQDDLLLRRDKHPNSAGAELLGYAKRDEGAALAALPAEIAAGRIRHLLVVGHDLDAHVTALGKLETLVLVHWNRTAMAGAATVFLPGAAWYEKAGTFVNFQGRLQRFEACFAPTGGKPEWFILLELLVRLGHDLGCSEVPGIFAAMAKAVPALAGKRWPDLPKTGVIVSAAEVAS